MVLSFQEKDFILELKIIRKINAKMIEIYFVNLVIECNNLSNIAVFTILDLVKAITLMGKKLSKGHIKIMKNMI